MEAWQRFERWVLCGLGVLFLGLFTYIAWPRTMEPPIPEFGKPVDILRTRGSTQAVFVIRQPLWEAYNRFGYKLQNRGFKQPPDTWDGLLTRNNNTEWIRMMQGEWLQIPNNRGQVRWDPNVTTVVYSIRRPTWWRAWRRIERDWTLRKQQKAQKAAMASLRGGIYP